jgi:hypothetical protein
VASIEQKPLIKIMNLLILIKNSPLDQSIINFTASLFNTNTVSIHLLNLVPTSGEVPTQTNGRVLEFSTEFDLSGYLSKTDGNLKFLNSIQHKNIVKRDSLIGNTTIIIQDYINTHKIDLIIAGAHKTSFIEDAFVNTFASRTIENTNIPYLIIKCNRDNFIPKRIALIGDFLKTETEELNCLKRIAEIHNSQIVLTKVQTDSDQRSKKAIVQEMNTFSLRNKLNASFRIINDIDKEAALTSLQNDPETDLIVMPRSKKKSIFQFLGQTKQADIVNHIYAPILFD